MACRSENLAPIDTPYIQISNLLGLEHDISNAKVHGFSGKLCLHPTQLAATNAMFRPSAKEVRWARKVESARRAGSLSVLRNKLGPVSPEGGQGDHCPTDAMAIMDGYIVGPPHVKTAQRILDNVGDAHFNKNAEANSMVCGRVVSSSITSDPNAPPVAVGDILSNPYEMTITEGMRDLWLGTFYSHSPAATSALFARESGLVTADGKLPSPFTMSLYVAVSMSSTHGAIFHLGYRNGRQLLPIEIGDTVHHEIRVKSVHNTEDGKRAVICTTRRLIRSCDGAVVFEIDKLEMHRRQPRDLGDSAPQAFDLTPNRSAFDKRVLAGANNAVAQRRQRKGWESAKAFEKGELLLHSFRNQLEFRPILRCRLYFL